MHLAGNSKSKIPPTFHQLHKDMRIRPSPWRERVEDMTSRRHSGRYASMSEERSKTCTSLILTFIFKCLTDDFWQNCNDRSLYPVLYLFDCKPRFTNMFFIILCGLQSRALTFFFFKLIEFEKSRCRSVFPWLLFVEQALFSHYLSSLEHHVHTPSQKRLWCTEGNCSGEASLPGLPIKRETWLYTKVSQRLWSRTAYNQGRLTLIFSTPFRVAYNQGRGTSKGGWQSNKCGICGTFCLKHCAPILN